MVKLIGTLFVFVCLVYIGGAILLIAVLAGLCYLIYRLILYLLKVNYFNSSAFLIHVEQVKSIVDEYNEIVAYVGEMPHDHNFLASKTVIDNGGLAQYTNLSKHNYVRNRNTRTANSNSSMIYPASLQITKRASEEPIKYLCKYFQIPIADYSLIELEKINTNISRMKNTLDNLSLREKQLRKIFNPPWFILKYFYHELISRIGMDMPNVELVYSEYIFEYVSAGGNSSQRTTITFDSATVEATMSFISEKLQHKKSAKTQRALMTNWLRNTIKERDNYTCQLCHVSLAEQNLLLLEVDHIIPISKGGLSTIDNLQTLCWKCNRTKSNKIL